MIRRMIVAVAALGAVLVAALVALAVRSPGPTHSLSSADSIEVSAPSTVTAGDDLVVEVRASESGQVRLTASTPLVTSSELVEIGAEQPAQIPLAPAVTEIAGTMIVQVTATNATATAIVEVVPAEPVEPLVPLVGPRTIVANGRDFTMVVLLAVDEYGNAVADGTEFVTTAQRENGDRSDVDLQSDAAIAAARIPARTTSGRLELWAGAGELGGPVATILEVPGRPAPFTLESPPSTFTADAFTLHRLSTTPLADQFGNVLTDGVLVTFTIDDAAGRRVSTAPVIDGRAVTWVESPPLPGTMSIEATVGGTTSAPFEIDFESAISDIAASVTAVDNGDLLVDIGPVRTVDRTYPPDGTTAVVNNVVVPLRAGEGMIRVPAADVVTIEILGRTTTLEVPR